MNRSEQSMRWSQFASLKLAIAMAPPREGVYAIGLRVASYGLPTTFSWAYIGRSENLQYRLARHQPWVETNSGLKNWLLENLGHSEVWFALTPDGRSRAAEKRLVRAHKPLHNQILFGAYENE